MRYDISGNIICKSDVSNTNCNSGTNYTYYTGTSSGPGPHAVAQVSTHNGNRHYEYDANGNVTKESTGPSITARRMEYTPSNLLRRGTTPGQGYSEFHYGIDRQRVIRRHGNQARSEEHTSELQSRGHLVCRLLLENKKQYTNREATASTKKEE